LPIEIVYRDVFDWFLKPLKGCFIYCLWIYLTDGLCGVSSGVKATIFSLKLPL
jgi:hypothetical protein